MQNGWNDFLSTGRVDAYLLYREHTRDSVGHEGTQDNSGTGDNPYAGVPNHNGNGDESSTYRGI